MDEADLLRKRVSFTAELRGSVRNPKTDKQRQHASALGGLRSTVKSIQRLHGHQILGPGIAGLANKFLDAYPLIERQIEDAISGSHSKKVDPRTLGPKETDLDLFRGLPGRALGTTDVTATRSATCSDIRGGLLRVWAMRAKDSGAAGADWCWDPRSCR